MKPVLDETGRLIPREDYRLSTLNCDGEILPLRVCGPISAIRKTSGGKM